jgi:hypothetical protein
VLRTKRSRSTACSGDGGGGVLWVKWSSSIEGKAVEAMTCSGGEADKGVLHRRRRASSVGGVEDLKRACGENLLSVEQTARTPDIYIGGQMHDVHSLRCVAHFFRRVAHYF